MSAREDSAIRSKLILNFSLAKARAKVRRFEDLVFFYYSACPPHCITLTTPNFQPLWG